MGLNLYLIVQYLEKDLKKKKKVKNRLRDFYNTSES